MQPVTFKIVVVGDSSVGKTAIIRKFALGSFDTQICPTVGADFTMKRFLSGDQNTKLSIWDTAGQERFRCLIPAFYRRAQGTVLVYDVSNRRSFDHLDDWLLEIEQYTTEKHVKMLVANKVDFLDIAVSQEEGKAFARRHKMLFVETSAKTGENINLAFQKLVEKMIEDLGATNDLNVRLGRSTTLPSFCNTC